MDFEQEFEDDSDWAACGTIAESKRKYFPQSIKGKLLLSFEDPAMQELAQEDKLSFEHNDNPNITVLSKIPAAHVYCFCQKSKPDSENLSDMVLVHNSKGATAGPSIFTCRFKVKGKGGCNLTFNSVALTMLIKLGIINLKAATTKYFPFPICDICSKTGAYQLTVSPNTKSLYYNKPVLGCKCWMNKTRGQVSQKSANSVYVPFVKSAASLSEEPKELHSLVTNAKNWFNYDNFIKSVEIEEQGGDIVNFLELYKPRLKTNKTEKKESDEKEETNSSSSESEAEEEKKKPKKLKTK